MNLMIRMPVSHLDATMIM